MNFRSVFFNTSNNLRAAWRIGILLLLWLTLSMAVAGIFALFVEAHGKVLLPIVYALLLVSTFVVLRVIDRRPFRSVGLSLHSRVGLEWAQGVFISFLMITAVFFVEYVLGYVHLT